MSNREIFSIQLNSRKISHANLEIYGSTTILFICTWRRRHRIKPNTHRKMKAEKNVEKQYIIWWIRILRLYFSVWPITLHGKIYSMAPSASLFSFVFLIGVFFRLRCLPRQRMCHFIFCLHYTFRRTHTRAYTETTIYRNFLLMTFRMYVVVSLCFYSFIYVK